MKTILVGADGSHRQPKVLKVAIELAQQQGAMVHLVRAMMIPVGIPSAVWTLSGDDFSSFLVEHGEAELKRVAERIPAENRGPLACILGQPADVLCELAEEMKADLVVIGSHGYGGLDRVLGTTAAKVVNRAPCSVMVVR